MNDPQKEERSVNIFYLNRFHGAYLTLSSVVDQDT